MTPGEHEKAAKTEHTSPLMYDEIWLQCPNRDSMSEWYGEVTWAEDKINDDDTKYIRADIAESLKQQRDELLAEFNAYKEGSEEAFGTVVAQKQAAEARLQTMQSTIVSQQGVIFDFRRQRDELLAALEGTLPAINDIHDLQVARAAIASVKEK